MQHAAGADREHAQTCMLAARLHGEESLARYSPKFESDLPDDRQIQQVPAGMMVRRIRTTNALSAVSRFTDGPTFAVLPLPDHSTVISFFKGPKQIAVGFFRPDRKAAG